MFNPKLIILLILHTLMIFNQSVQFPSCKYSIDNHVFKAMRKKNKPVSPEKATNLIQKMKGEIDEDLKELINDPNIIPYKLRDNSILIIDKWDSYGFLYRDRKDLEAIIQKNQDFKIEDFEKEMHPFTASFKDELDGLIPELSKKLNINIGQLDYSIASLELIDKKIQKFSQKKLLDNFLDMYKLLIAYAYKTLQTHLKGEIIFVPHEDVQDVYLIQVIDKEGKTYCPAPRIYDELKFNRRHCSIGDVIDSEMFKYGFMDLMKK